MVGPLTEKLLKIVMLWTAVSVAGAAFGSDAVDTVGGRLRVTSDAEEATSTILLADKTIAAYSTARLDLVRLFRFKEADVVLLEFDAGGRNTYTYRLLVLTTGKAPYISDEFGEPGGAPIGEPVLTPNILKFVSGVSEGRRYVVTYTASGVAINREEVPRGIAASRENCDFLYLEIYRTHVENGRCDAELTPSSPMYVVRDFNAAMSDPGVDASMLSEIAKQSCRERKVILLGDFERKVCRGR